MGVEVSMGGKALKEPPLLLLAKNWDSPFQEIPPHRISRLKDPRFLGGMHELARARVLAWMQNLGLDIHPAIEGFRPGLEAILSESYKYDTNTNAQYRANLLILGIIPKGDYKWLEGIIPKVLEDLGKKDCTGLFLELAGSAQTLGIDVSWEVKKYSPLIERELDSLQYSKNWRNFVNVAEAMSRLDFPLQERVAAHRKAILYSLSSTRDYFDYLNFASDAASLGLLTPNPDYRRPKQDKAPPMREWGDSW